MIGIPEVYDMLGRQVTEGDRVAVAVSQGDSSVMKIGRVTMLTKAKMTILLEKKGYSFQKDTISVYHTLKKFININHLPQSVDKV